MSPYLSWMRMTVVAGLFWLLAGCVLPVVTSAQPAPPLRAEDAIYLPQVGRRALPAGLLRVAAGPGAAQPALAPDNGSVVYVGNAGSGTGGVDLFTVALTDTQPLKLTDTPAMTKETPVFSPDGATIAFAAHNGQDWDIVAVDAAGGTPRPLAAQAGSDEVQPAYTPDGATLFFSSNRAGGNWDIYSMPATGGDWVRVTTAEAVDRFPVLSQDGATVVFRRFEAGNSDIWAMQRDGTQVRRLTTAPTYDAYPAASPAHGAVLFATAGGEEAHLWATNLGGATPVQLLPEAGWSAFTPRLAYDGRWLVYAATIEGEAALVVRPFVPPLVQVGLAGFDRLENDCGWEAGILAWGWGRGWQATGDRRFLGWLRAWVDHCLTAGATVAHVNDVPLGYAARIVHGEFPEQKYADLADSTATYLFDTAPRTADGTLIHLEQMVWDDTLAVVVPFLAVMWGATGEERYRQEAVDQLLLHAAHLQDEGTGLFHHAWSEPQAALSGPSYWARGNGWALASLAEGLRMLPEGDGRRPAVLAAFQRQAAGLVARQDATGRWPTVVTQPGYYLESSGSALIAAALTEGVARGWLGATLAPAAARARRGTWQQIGAAGIMQGVSGVTGPMADESAYNQIPVGDFYRYGQGAALVMGAAEALGTQTSER